MTKRKLQRFAENATFPNLFQPKINYPPVDDELKGKWNSNVFQNNHPVILELGCGRGEYTVNLAELFPLNNYIGIDFKGARLWRGAKTALEKNMHNVAFLRIQIQHLGNYFAQAEISEIWITFPDPQPQMNRMRKRLTSPGFLAIYKSILRENGIIHLKTDHTGLYEYSLDMINENKFPALISTNDLYESEIHDDILGIKTTYEKIFLEKGSKICYLKFKLK